MHFSSLAGRWRHNPLVTFERVFDHLSKHIVNSGNTDNGGESMCVYVCEGDS